MSIYVLGDIHGAYKALVQVFERSNFTPEEDTLVFLGDVVDGWLETPKCVQFLLDLKCEKYFIQGNHDEWCHSWLAGKLADPGWISQGGLATWDAYKLENLSTLRRHKEAYFDQMLPYLEKDGNLFVHGGFNWHAKIDEQPRHNLWWDRNLWDAAQELGFRVPDYKEVFIGHTTTSRTSSVPERRANVWNLDQGAGWEGRLSLMNIDTKEFVQSDVVKTLYPLALGRGTFKW